MIKPTVGRVVWFWPSNQFLQHRALHGDPFTVIPGDEPCVGIISKVWNDFCVNLAVFDHNGKSHAVTSCALRQDHPISGESYCEWMPYQKGQAAKTEAAEQFGAQMARAAGIPLP